MEANMNYRNENCDVGDKEFLDTEQESLYNMRNLFTLKPEQEKL